MNPLDDHFFNEKPDLEYGELIGKGSFGCVYKAYDRLRQRTVAVKRSAKVGSLVSREYKVLKEVVGSAYCVQLLDIFYTVNADSEFIQHLVFEYLPGNLGKKLRTHYKRGTQCTHSEITCVMKQILQGLEFIHSKGIMHRDLKPDNILIDDTVFPYTIKLCDFGSAKKTSELNTPYIVSRYYRAPELVFCNSEYDEKIDIWAAGCIFLEMYHCVPIFRGTNEGDQFIKQTELLGPPTLDDVMRLTQHSDLPAEVAAKATRIGSRTLGVDFFKEAPRADEALDLVNKMLAWNPDRRWTAKECLQHSFFSPPA